MSETKSYDDTKKQSPKGEKNKISFVPKDHWKLLFQGAEARVWKIPSQDLSFSIDDEFAIAKERFSKAYRHPILDERLTKQRCRAEARILEKCAKANLCVPLVWRVEAPILYLQYLQQYRPLRHVLNQLIMDKNQTTAASTPDDSTEQQEDQEVMIALALAIGNIVANLHNMGVIHGDLTTSNMMLKQSKGTAVSLGHDLALIDFGLAKNTESAEERAVDLYVLERALASTHPELPDEFWKQLLDAYDKSATKSKATLTRLEQVRMRGRKRDCFG